MIKILLSVICFGLSFGFELKKNLSEYQIFVGDPKELVPSEGFVHYELITPLFTDYALKHRLINIPDQGKIEYKERQVFDFPKGSMIVKTFYYPHDFDHVKEGIDLVETRLLVHETSGWKAYPYIWNEDDTEAVLSVAGGIRSVTWKDQRGTQTIDYIVPNMNQCKGCHVNDGDFLPIGPTARQLNKDLEYIDGTYNQLSKWQDLGLLRNLPDFDAIPRIADWDNPKSGSLDQRARAWLDINCAHCHNVDGPAKTSGLFLDYYQEDSKALGIYKTPVAAGRGSGKFEYDIVPGDPDHSILVYRFNSTDPGIMMPELGRTLVHHEGLNLIREWILSLR